MTINCQKINRVGIELEGAWHIDTAKRRLKEDGSVGVSCDCSPCRRVENGEKASRTLLPVTKSIKTFVETNYPDHVNSSCGMHVHVSFKKDSDYARLMEPAFNQYFKHELNAWGHRANIKNTAFWERLEGSNTFCKDEFIPQQQFLQTSKRYTRYTQLNFCYSVGRRKCAELGCPGSYRDYCRLHSVGKTLEIRVLPMFKSKSVSIAAIEQVLTIIERFLLFPVAEYASVESVELESEEINEVEDNTISIESINQSEETELEVFESEYLIETINRQELVQV